MLKGQESSSMGTCREYFEGTEFPGSVRKKKRVEFEEMLKGQESLSMGICRDYFEGTKFPESVRKKKKAEFEEVLKGPESSSMGTCREYFEGTEFPGSVRKKKRADFEEMFKGLDSSSMGTCSGYFEGKKIHDKEGVGVETRDGVSGVKKRFLGVVKRGNRWRARTTNPLLRADVHLGYYRTPEEAALVVKKKKAEFKEMFKEQESSSTGTCRGYFEGKKLPVGVKRQNGRYRVHIRHPKLKIWVSGGSYRTCEEAATVADKKREEFQEMYGEEVRKPRVMYGDAKVPPGVRRIQSGKWVARIKKPESKDRIWLGTYDTLEEAISSYNKKKAEFDAKRKRPEFDCAEFRPGSEAGETRMKFGNELGYHHPTSLLSAHNLNNNVALHDNSSYDYGVVDIPGKLGVGLVYSSPTSVSDQKNINTASVGDKTFDSEFDRAVSLGIINEYGQLLGKYCEIDTQMRLSTTDEYVSDSAETFVV